MSFAGQGTLSKKRSDVANQRLPAVGFQKIRFAHKASAGDTGFNVNSLVVPPEMSANGFTNPSAATLSGAQLLFYRNNLTLWSSVNKELVDEYQYTIASSGQISFINGYVAVEGEIFVGKIDYNATNGIQVVAAISPPATGTIAAGQTDFNVGFPFQVGLNISAQIGAVLFLKNGQLLVRNTANASAATVLAGGATGDYQEVDAGNGLGQILRLNVADPDNASTVVAIPNGRLAEMPNGSMLAVIEALNGQVNNIATYVAAMAGQTQATILGSSPTNSNLQVFGQIVQNLQALAALTNQTNTFTSYQVIPGRTDGASAASGILGEYRFAQPSSPVSPTTSNQYVIVATLPLPAGEWEVWGALNWSIGTGTGNTVLLAVLGSAPGGVPYTGQADSSSVMSSTQSFAGIAGVRIPVGKIRVIAPAGGTTVYLEGNAFFSTLGSAGYNTDSIIQARRVG